jgi:hypothetical protein
MAAAGRRPTLPRKVTIMGERGWVSWCRRVFVVAGAAIAVGAAAAAPARAATAANGRSVLWRATNALVDVVAMDGFQVAIADTRFLSLYPPRSRLIAPYFCDRVELVSVHGGAPTRLSRHDFFHYCDGGGSGVRGLALAGSRAYWDYDYQHSDPRQQVLLTGAPGSAERMLVGPVIRTDHELGPFLGPIAASGTSLAYSTYRLTKSCLPTHCTFSVPLDTTLTLRGERVALPAPGGIVASVDSGRAAVLLDDGRVAIVTRHAPPVIVGPAPRAQGPAGGAAVAGRRLVVLAAQRLWAYDAATGHLHASWPAKGAMRVDLWNGVAVITTRRQIVAVRLSNGHRQLIQQISRGRAFVGGAQIEAGGIVWATNTLHLRYIDPSIVWHVPLPALH